MKATTELKKTVQNTQNRTETGQYPAGKKSRLPKTHQDYWQGRLRKRSYIAPDGKTEIEIPIWQVRLFHCGKEGWFNLGTANQAAAVVKARDIYVFLKANGWDATLVKFKPDSDIAPRLNLTVGEYLNAVKLTGHLRLRTFLNYQTCLRTIVSEAFGVKSDDAKYDYRHGGNQKWAERVNGIRLERVTPARVIAWQQRRIKQAGNSPVALASAKRTANSYVRCARSLFVKDILMRVKGVKLPSKLPFDGVELFESGNTKYVSKVDVHTLIAAARNELKPNEPETYKAFLLGLFAGMRRAEIDLAEWRMAVQQFRTKTATTKADEVEHVASFEKLWAGLADKWAATLSAAEREIFTRLETENERDAFRIVQSYARKAEQDGAADFPIVRDNLGDRLGITGKGAAWIRDKLVRLGAIKKTANYVPNKFAARFKWLFAISCG